MNPFTPKDFQQDLPSEAFIVQTEVQKSDEDIQLDVLFVGAGPASLSSAIHLAQQAKKNQQSLEIGIMEKADQIGGHSLSGAIIKPLVFQWLFPDKKLSELPLRQKVKKEAFYLLSKNRAFPLFMPPGMRSKNHWTGSLCEVVRFLAQEAEKLGVHIFPSFPAEKLLMNSNKIIGVVSKAYGLNKDGSKEGNAEEPTKIFAKAVVLAEGSRGHLTQAYLQQQKIESFYPQTYALGVKEIWEVPQDPQKVFHTLAWPLDSQTFGGSWFYPLGDQKVSLGLVAGLDSPDADLSVHDKLQKLKQHPLFQKYLKGGKCIEWGAKSIPEGGYHALPQRLSGDGVLILGDSAGFVNMASLKGIHYAMASGYYAAQSLYEAVQKQDFSYETLKSYDEKIKKSFIAKDLYPYRNLRQSFHKGLLRGLVKAGLITLSRGRLPLDFKKSQLKTDAEIPRKFPRKLPKAFQSKEGESSSIGLTKSTAVYLSGNQTRDKIPSHLLHKAISDPRLGRFYARMCPAGVYEQKGEQGIVNPPNCIDCKATDVLGPRWTPRERGSGPNYKLM